MIKVRATKRYKCNHKSIIGVYEGQRALKNNINSDCKENIAPLIKQRYDNFVQSLIQYKAHKSNIHHDDHKGINGCNIQYSEEKITIYTIVVIPIMPTYTNCDCHKIRGLSLNVQINN